MCRTKRTLPGQHALPDCLCNSLTVVPLKRILACGMGCSILGRSRYQPQIHPWLFRRESARYSRSSPGGLWYRPAAFIDADVNLPENPATGNVKAADVAGSHVYALIAQASVGSTTASCRLDELLRATPGAADTTSCAGPLAGRLGGQIKGIGGAPGDAGVDPRIG